MIIDSCCHIEIDGDLELRIENLLRTMDQLAIDQAVLQPVAHCFAWENEAGNDQTIAAAKKYPGRFITSVTANPWRPDGWEMIRKYLDLGGRMLTFSPGVQGFNPAEGKLDSILTNLVKQKLRIPVYIHTGHHSHGAPSQLAILANRFPEMHFIMGHSGATDYWTDVIPACKICPNIWIELSFRPEGFASTLKEIGYDRGIYGSGYPYTDIALDISEIKRLMPEQHHRAVFGATLMNLLGSEAGNR